MITPEKILELKHLSGASLSACKSALETSHGDLVRALALLNESSFQELRALEQATGLGVDECRKLLAEWGSTSKVLAYLGRNQKKELEPQLNIQSKSRLHVKPFSEIWDISDSSQFVHELSQYLTDKKWFRKSQLNQNESTFYLLATMQAAIEAEGFVDLFYQEYSLDDCKLVENGLRELGLQTLADLFSEAKSIYIRHNPKITRAEYETLDPFELSEKEGQRLDYIADEFYADGSELFQIHLKLASYARARRTDFSP